ncbi:hypothetical protein POX_g08541 [Penicillium oxalicum]|uniref:Uncharacterized protein n=1 Tax=Penicillium oxalicum (strain 114-2 / CGMCC 5302) TaxID=933388 RepID=S7Z964_PENO1|nr:hypothetical protein POX_g08541 [Penicillium oxalicum]EPS27160.1 hypothetical protein PDE_02103 [Penicillium oxalicum 114-2]KAI2786159.1 hypothetical protein POX_g08541 [Penicillium oxalicum]
MDKLSGLASKLGGGSKTESNQNAAAGNEDYLDKALDSAERKYGGGHVDPAKMRSTNEKITDGVRNQFESATGKHVPEKFSN